LPLLAALLVGPAWLSAGDWPGWRGPDRTGVSAETGLLKAWPDGGPPLAWKATGLGGGYSTPSVARGRIYLLGSRDNREYLIALTESDGKEVWAAELGAVGRDGPPSYPGPRSTPTVDGDRVYALGSDGDLVCVDTAGKSVWRKNLGKDLNGVRGHWAYAESPLIDGDVLVCTPGGPKATLAALNKKTGEVIWKATVPGGDSGGGGGRGPRRPPNAAAYASPIVAEVGGVKQYVQLLGGFLVGVSARDGKLLWRYDKITGITNCTTPIFHDGCVFVSASGRGPGPTSGGALVRLTTEGGGVTAKEVYHNKDLANHHGGVVLVGDALYGTNATSLVCVDFKTGETRWQNRSVGKGSVAAADGRLYVRGEKAGQVALVEASPAGYKEAGRLKQPERSDKMAWPHPVIANGRLYLRDQGVLLCYDVKAR
jgi:outer membrane protein assembly factor BamB